MAIKKRGKAGIYYTDFSISGERIRVSTGTANKAQASEYEARLKDSLWRQSRLKEKPKYTLSQAIIKYFKEVQKSENEIEKDKTKLRFWIERLGDVPLHTINRERLKEIIDDMQVIRPKTNKETGEVDLQSRPSANATKNRYLAVLRHLFRLAHAEWGWIDSLPSFPMQKEPKGRLLWATHEQANQLIAALPEYWRDPVDFALSTGLREGNIMGLTWSQIDFKHQHAWIDGRDTKNKKPLPIPLTERAMEIIIRNKGRHPKYVFSREGQRLNYVDSDTWKRAVKKAGLPLGFTFHCLRHTWASWHAQNGTSPFILQKLGGWSTLEMVLRYVHLNSDTLKAHANNTGRKIGTNLAQGENQENLEEGKSD